VPVAYAFLIHSRYTEKQEIADLLAYN